MSTECRKVVLEKLPVIPQCSNLCDIEYKDHSLPQLVRKACELTGRKCPFISSDLQEHVPSDKSQIHCGRYDPIAGV